MRSIKMFAKNTLAGKGDLKLKQAHYSGFEISKNIATTRGKIFDHIDVADIVQYTSTTDRVLKQPLLICPPMD